MIKSRHTLLCAGLLASATFASTGALAQKPTTTPVPPAAEAQVQAPAKQQARQGDRQQRFERMQARRAAHLAQLKEKLKLTPAQEPAWSSFASAQQPPARAPGAERADFGQLTTPERLDRMQARQAERNARFARRADATRGFYAALTPEQQKTFDAESMPRFGPRGPGEHGGRGHGGHHPQVQPAAKS
jgi:thiol:disulfide interchange protein